MRTSASLQYGGNQPNQDVYQDQEEARHQGRQEGDVRQDGHCQGQASEDGGQGVRCCGPEGQHLSACHVAADVSTPVLRGATHGTGKASAESKLWRVAAASVDPAEASSP